jgi:hypothetical protein
MQLAATIAQYPTTATPLGYLGVECIKLHEQLCRRSIIRSVPRQLLVDLVSLTPGLGNRLGYLNDPNLAINVFGAAVLLYLAIELAPPGAKL